LATRFRFRLEGLLKLRKALEADAQRHLAKAIQARNLTQLRHEQLGKEHQRILESRRLQPGEAVDLDHWRAIERYLVVLEKSIERTRIELQEAEKRVVEARQVLTKAHQGHLMLLRLKERRQALHAHEVLQEEFRDQDELSVLRYRFNTRPQTAMTHEVPS
jgi:flagellar export protein FliJ